MATKDNKPKLIVDNLGPWIQSLKDKIEQLDKLEAEVKAQKIQLREIAQPLVPLGTAGTVTFLCPSGKLEVGFKDPTAGGNRGVLSASVLEAAERAGIKLAEVTEAVEEIVLGGVWVQWFLNALKGLAGQVIPEGWTHSKKTKLSAAGVRKLRELIEQKGPAAQAAAELLSGGLATATVKIGAGK